MEVSAIKKKYCQGNLVQAMPYSGNNHLIINSDEIILLKINGNVLINKYSNHPLRPLFPFSEKEQTDNFHFTELFEYNRSYLDYTTSISGIKLNQEYFLPGTSRALAIIENLISQKSAQVKTILTRRQIEELFNPLNYEQMYVFNDIGNILLAKSQKDNLLINYKVIPSDEEIVERELSEREFFKNLSNIINNSSKEENRLDKKSIENIKNIQLFGPLFGSFSDILLTVKNQKISLNWFRIEFLEKDKFQLEMKPIKIIIPTIDDIMEYANNKEILYTSEPSGSLDLENSNETPKTLLKRLRETFQRKKK